MEIDQATIARTLQLGSQYAIPAAATVRALYSGYKGDMPSGLLQIAAASLFAGVTALADNKAPDPQAMIREVLGNTVFLAGLLSFVVIYLLKTRLRVWLDAAVGGALGFVASWIWIYYLGNPWPVWAIPLAAVAGAAIMIVLHSALRHIMRLVRLATALLVIGLVLVIAAGGLYLAQQQGLVNLPIPKIR